MRRYGPVVTLLLLAPLIGEVLFGAVPLSRLPFGLLGLVGLYGGGAILVREVVRRRRLSSLWLVVLGLAYGIVEEGTVLQSLFDQHYPGLDFLGFYGHWVGVNWVWSEFIVPYHAVFSIAIPILLTELIFPDRREHAWLGPRELVGVGALFAANGVLLAIFKVGLFTTHAPKTSLGSNLGAAVVAAGLIGAALRAQPHMAQPASINVRSASPRRLRLIGLLSGLGWFVGLRVLLIGDGKLMPPVAVLLGGLVIGMLAWWRIAHWSSPRHAWTPEHTYALVAGALPTSWLLGFLIAAVSGGSIILNLIGQVIFGFAMFLGLRRLRDKIRRGMANCRMGDAVA